MSDLVPEPTSPREVADHLRLAHGLDLGTMPGRYEGQAEIDHHTMHKNRFDHAHEHRPGVAEWPIIVAGSPIRCAVCDEPIGGVREVVVSALLDAVKRHIATCHGRAVEHD